MIITLFSEYTYLVFTYPFFSTYTFDLLRMKEISLSFFSIFIFFHSRSEIQIRIVSQKLDFHLCMPTYVLLWPNGFHKRVFLLSYKILKRGPIPFLEIIVHFMLENIVDGQILFLKKSCWLSWGHLLWYFWKLIFYSCWKESTWEGVEPFRKLRIFL